MQPSQAVAIVRDWHKVAPPEGSAGAQWLHELCDLFIDDWDDDRWEADAWDLVFEFAGTRVDVLGKDEAARIAFDLSAWTADVDGRVPQIHPAEFSEWIQPRDEEDEAPYSRQKRKGIEEYAARVNELLADPRELLRRFLFAWCEAGLHQVGEALAEAASEDDEEDDDDE